MQISFSSAARAARKESAVTGRIVLSTLDVSRLRSILSAARQKPRRDHDQLDDLRDEIEQAQILEAEEMPEDVVVLDASVTVCDIETSVCSDYVVVSPSQADVTKGRISVLAPLGTALLGYRQGTQIRWRMPGGIRSLKIRRVVQPPSAGGMRWQRPEIPGPNDLHSTGM